MRLRQSKPHIPKNATLALIRTYLKPSHHNELILIIHLKQNNESGPGWNRATTESFFQSCGCSGKLHLIQMATGPAASLQASLSTVVRSYVDIYVHGSSPCATFTPSSVAGTCGAGWSVGRFQKAQSTCNFSN